MLVTSFIGLVLITENRFGASVYAELILFWENWVLASC